MVVTRPKRIDPRPLLIAACVGLIAVCTVVNLGNYNRQNGNTSALLELEYLFSHNENKLSNTHRIQFDKDKAAAMDYVKSFDSTSFNRPLSFFHIPKTAGTAIEHVAGSSSRKIGWGSCMFNHGKRKRTDCEYPSGGKCKYIPIERF
jgi:hypothetical protein